MEITPKHPINSEKNLIAPMPNIQGAPGLVIRLLGGDR